jgi:hypothetical protein
MLKKALDTCGNQLGFFSEAFANDTTNTPPVKRHAYNDQFGLC